MPFRKVLSSLAYREEASNDHLEAYPEHYHVEALPERRYLKTARFWVVATLISMALNFAMCFIYIRNASLVEAVVDIPTRQDNFLYNLDYFNKELKPVEKSWRVLNKMDLIYQNLIQDYLTQRYQITSNRAEMSRRWGQNGKVFAYAPKLYEKFLPEAEAGLKRQASGLTQDIYIYSIKNVSRTNFYEAVFDVFSLNESGYGKQKCPCYIKTQECLKCMRGTAVNVQRNKAYMRVTLAVEEKEREAIPESVNPYYFLILDLYILPQAIHLDNVWEDADTILE